MKVSYITMQFPAPSETFASNDVRKLGEAGVEIRVHGLLTRHRRGEVLRLERGLADVAVTHNGLLPTLRGALAALTRPRLLARTLAWLLSTVRNPNQLLRSLLLLPRAFDILEELERDRPDVVHLYWGHYPSLVGFLVQGALPSVGTSISLVAYDLEMAYPCTGEVARRAGAVRTLARVNVPDVARLTGLPEGRVEVIPDGVDLAALDRVAARRDKIPGRIVTAGRLIEEKGMDDVLDAFALVRERHPKATLAVLGEGPQDAKLRAKARELGLHDAVRFLGHVSHQQVIEELAAAQALLLLSRKSSERLPNVVKEGMACRAVCITTATPGIEELLEHGRTGFVVPMNDAEAAAACLDRVLAGKIPAAMRVLARAHINERFDLERTSRGYLNLWRRALDAARQPVPSGATPAVSARGARS